jgi:hypothetical protein
MPCACLRANVALLAMEETNPYKSPSVDDEKTQLRPKARFGAYVLHSILIGSGFGAAVFGLQCLVDEPTSFVWDWIGDAFRDLAIGATVGLIVGCGWGGVQFVRHGLSSRNPVADGELHEKQQD